MILYTRKTATTHYVSQNSNDSNVCLLISSIPITHNTTDTSLCSDVSPLSFVNTTWALCSDTVVIMSNTNKHWPAVNEQCMLCFAHRSNKLIHDATWHVGIDMFSTLAAQSLVHYTDDWRSVTLLSRQQCFKQRERCNFKRRRAWQTCADWNWRHDNSIKRRQQIYTSAAQQHCQLQLLSSALCSTE